MAEIGGRSKEVITDLPHILHVFGLHRRFNGTRNSYESLIFRQRDGFEAITIRKELEVRFTRWRVGEHRHSLWHESLVIGLIPEHASFLEKCAEMQ